MSGLTIPIVLVLQYSSGLLQAFLQVFGVHCPDRQLVQALHERDIALHRKLDDILLQAKHAQFIMLEIMYGCSLDLIASSIGYAALVQSLFSGFRKQKMEPRIRAGAVGSNNCKQVPSPFPGIRLASNAVQTIMSNPNYSLPIPPRYRMRVVLPWETRTVDKDGLDSSSVMSTSSASFIASSVPPELRMLDSELVSTESMSGRSCQNHSMALKTDLLIVLTMSDRLQMTVKALEAKTFSSLPLLPRQSLV